MRVILLEVKSHILSQTGATMCFQDFQATGSLLAILIMKSKYATKGSVHYVTILMYVGCLYLWGVLNIYWNCKYIFA